MGLPGLRRLDHVGFTVPDLDEAVRFFVQALGAQELFRSTRGPEPEFMPEHFAVPEDARLTLAMLRLPPNLRFVARYGRSRTTSASEWHSTVAPQSCEKVITSGRPSTTWRDFCPLATADKSSFQRQATTCVVTDCLLGRP